MSSGTQCCILRHSLKLAAKLQPGNQLGVLSSLSLNVMCSRLLLSNSRPNYHGGHFVPPTHPIPSFQPPESSGGCSHASIDGRLLTGFPSHSAALVRRCRAPPNIPTPALRHLASFVRLGAAKIDLRGFDLHRPQAATAPLLRCPPCANLCHDKLWLAPFFSSDPPLPTLAIMLALSLHLTAPARVTLRGPITPSRTLPSSFFLVLPLLPTNHAPCSGFLEQRFATDPAGAACPMQS